MKKLIVITILSSLIIVGCGKKPQPSPEEVIPEIPEPIATVEVVETPQEDLSDVVIEVNDGNAEVVEVDKEVGAATENEEPVEEPSEEVEPAMEEVVVETQVVVDPVQDLDEIVPDSTWTEYMIKPGQTLSLIAYEEYGNPNEWRTIYGWNKEKIGDDPNMIHPYHYLDLLKPSENAVEFESDYYIHKVTRGESLWTISKKEYGDQYAWVVLFWDNEAVFQGNDGVLRPGMELKVRTELWPEF
ncbi:MAG: LysM peptidoglycan-binding domain-containing protein [Candidatus Marinimicrobia bacterium]|nr:LysM peptidoglycan-binding domain-containing protein [Candidatus Neomarinimicrobiota bacterium]